MLETLYEAAPRPHEFLGLRRYDILFKDQITTVHIEKGKTGSISIPVVGDAIPALSNWDSNHPKQERDARLWVDMSTNTTYEPLRWQGLNEWVKRKAKDGNVKKPVTLLHV
ncbi:MAG: hypothetical protein ACRECH_05385 [Nitrososphaerales archaeon]